MPHGGTPSKHEEIEVLRAQTIDVACIHVSNAACTLQIVWGRGTALGCMGFAWQTSYDRSRNDLGHSEERCQNAVKTEIARARHLGQ